MLLDQCKTAILETYAGNKGELFCPIQIPSCSSSNTQAFHIPSDRGSNRRTLVVANRTDMSDLSDWDWNSATNQWEVTS